MGRLVQWLEEYGESEAHANLVKRGDTRVVLRSCKEETFLGEMGEDGGKTLIVQNFALPSKRGESTFLQFGSQFFARYPSGFS